jgi:hypothetical protein
MMVKCGVFQSYEHSRQDSWARHSAPSMRRVHLGLTLLALFRKKDRFFQPKIYFASVLQSWIVTKKRSSGSFEANCFPLPSSRGGYGRRGDPHQGRRFASSGLLRSVAPRNDEGEALSPFLSLRAERSNSGGALMTPGSRALARLAMTGAEAIRPVCYHSVSGAKFGMAKAMPNSARGATWRVRGLCSISTMVQALGSL